jgi:hypothetical protein
MLTLLPNQSIPVAKHSRKYLEFLCTCGRTKAVMWKNYNTNHTRSCGSCLKPNIQMLLTKKWKFLSLDPDQTFPDNVVNKTPLLFRCDCGNSKKIVLASVLKNYTKSCGCGINRPPPPKPFTSIKLISKKEWLRRDLNLKLLDIDLPEKWGKSSKKVLTFKCTCGKVFKSHFGRVASGKRKTCSKCHHIKRDEYLGKQYGDLTFVDKTAPYEFHGRTDSEYQWLCKCGNFTNPQFSKVMNGSTTTCGNCNTRPWSWWKKQRFGPMKIIGPEFSYKLNSEQWVTVSCKCGSIVEKQVCSLTNTKKYHNTTCGNCRETGLKWLNNSPKIIKSNNLPAYPLPYLVKYFRGFTITPLSEIPTSVSTPSLWQCKICNKKYKTRLSDILNKKVVSCGCIVVSYSKASLEIGQYIESLGFSDVLYGKDEKRFGKYKADAFVPSVQTVIEFHGIRYHSKSCEKDAAKRSYIESLGIKYLEIWEDDWMKDKQACLDGIKQALS